MVHPKSKSNRKTSSTSQTKPKSRQRTTDGSLEISTEEAEPFVATSSSTSSSRTSYLWGEVSVLRGKIFHEFNSNWKGRPYKISVFILGIVVVILLWIDIKSSFCSSGHSTTTHSQWQHHFDWRSTSEARLVTLVPGELPGYTGWARPGKTLAGHFKLVAPLDIGKPAVAGEVWEMTVQCFHGECSNGGSFFFVRAYGPSVIVGKVHDNKDGSYRIELLPKDSGPYTVEVVLTFSNPPSIGQFPIPSDESEPGYEGYLLPEFPLPLQVVARKKRTSQSNLPLCPLDHFLETSPVSAWEKARWVVTDKINHPYHTDNPHHEQVTYEGYQDSYNSLGIKMQYQYDRCQPLPSMTPTDKNHPLINCANDKGSLNFIFIGDSNMRLQTAIFEKHFLGIPEDHLFKSWYNKYKIRATYFDISGGALRCNILGGEKNVTRFFETVKARVDDTLEQPERYVIIFNTGMHDIHRLCSHEFEKDRVSYLGATATDVTKGFHCVQHYRLAVEGLAQEISNFPADLRVFQSTTAGWPKYGNFDVTWPSTGKQNMPVATEFVDFFNGIAYDVLKDFSPMISIMDGYWISYARPDNREITIGPKQALEKKLSHPGFEVVSTLLRQWTSIVAQSEVCQRR